ncbi:CGNR zinc finger domain-containing protein [Actinomycetospora sp. C-140]
MSRRERHEERFVFLAGALALDLVNTVLVDGGALVDTVATPEELAHWVAASPLDGAPSAIPPAVHARTLAIRHAVRAWVDAVVEGGPVPDATIETLNAVLAAGPGTELTRGPEGALRYGVRTDLDADPAVLPWLLADAGARLFAGDRLDRLRRCANHDTCVLVFLDTSRNRARRWCSMEVCGNRSKVAAHEARRRRSSSS